MKKFTYYAAVLFLTAGLSTTTSCVDQIRVGDGFLEKAEGEDVNEDLIFSSKVYTEYLLWQCYEGLYSPFKSCYTLNSGVMEALSDIMHSELGWDDIGRMFYTGTLTAANANSGWVQSRFAFISQGGIENMSNQSKRSIWNCVRDCELLIDNISRVPDMSDEEKARYTAEAKIILACKYFDGIRHFGGLPIVDHAFSGEEQLSEGRASIEETVNFAIKLLDEAIAEPNLPWYLPEADLNTWAGRLTKGAAAALKAKILCYAASPIFNSDTPYCTEEPQVAVRELEVWYGNYDQKRWQAVVDACEDFFQMNAQNGNYYQLVQATEPTEEGYREAYRKAYRARGTRETIIEVHDRVYMTDWDQCPSNVWHSGACAATLDWMEMFPWSDGRNYDGQQYYGQRPAKVDIFANRDPRLYETMVVQKRDYKFQYYNADNPVQLWEGGEFLVCGSTWACKPWGFPTFKYVLDLGSNDQGGQGTIDDEPMQIAYLRMAEMYLIYAEALAECGHNTQAIEQVNIVRRRVGLGDIEVKNPQLNLVGNKDNLIKEIMRERACELGFECENRFHDMNRRLMISDFTKHLRGMHIYRLNDNNERVQEPWSSTSGEPFPTKFEYEEYEIQGANPRFVWSDPNRWSNKWILAPLPPDEINKNYGLTQNPGWY